MLTRGTGVTRTLDNQNYATYCPGEHAFNREDSHNPLMTSQNDESFHQASHLTQDANDEDQKNYTNQVAQ